jgi:hypothetical protein
MLQAFAQGLVGMREEVEDGRVGDLVADLATPPDPFEDPSVDERHEVLRDVLMARADDALELRGGERTLVEDAQDLDAKRHAEQSEVAREVGDEMVGEWVTHDRGVVRSGSRTNYSSLWVLRRRPRE